MKKTIILLVVVLLFSQVIFAQEESAAPEMEAETTAKPMEKESAVEKPAEKKETFPKFALNGDMIFSFMSDFSEGLAATDASAEVHLDSIVSFTENSELFFAVMYSARDLLDAGTNPISIDNIEIEEAILSSDVGGELGLPLGIVLTGGFYGALTKAYSTITGYEAEDLWIGLDPSWAAGIDLTVLDKEDLGKIGLMGALNLETMFTNEGSVDDFLVGLYTELGFGLSAEVVYFNKTSDAAMSDGELVIDALYELELNDMNSLNISLGDHADFSESTNNIILAAAGSHALVEDIFSLYWGLSNTLSLVKGNDISASNTIALDLEAAFLEDKVGIDVGTVIGFEENPVKGIDVSAFLNIGPAKWNIGYLIDWVDGDGGPASLYAPGGFDKGGFYISVFMDN